MNKRQGSYEKKLLVLMALLGIIIVGLLFWHSTGMPERLVVQKVTPKDELGEIPVERTQEAIKRLGTVFDWTAPIRNGKPVPLNKSVLIVLKGNELFDLFVENPQFRPPMTNEFLIKNELADILHENIGELDPDGDGFSNEEEFLAGTNPRDPNSKPPATDKLFLKERVTNDYILLFKSSSSMQVARLKPNPKNIFVTVGQGFGFDPGIQRFKALSLERKELEDPVRGRKDASELTCLDTATNEEFVLVLGEESNLAEYEAKFEFRLGKLQTITVKKGEQFQLPGTGATYRVIEVEEDSAKIVPLDAQGNEGAPLEIQRR